MGNELPPDALVYQAYIDLLKRAREVVALFEQESLTIPSTLKLFITSTSGSGSRPTRLRPPERPAAPLQAKNDWIWIPAKDGMVRTLFLAILNEGKPIEIKELSRRVLSYLPTANEGSIYNNVTQLKGKKIQKTDKGWILVPGTKAPILFQDNIWASGDLLHEQDLAAFRRMAILHVLALFPDGLQIMQMFRQLEGVDWLHTPLSKDLVKTDLFVLKDQKKVKRGSSNKWKLQEAE